MSKISLESKFEGREGDLVLFSSSDNHVCGLVGYVIKSTDDRAWLSNSEVKDNDGGMRKIKKSTSDITFNSNLEQPIYCTKLREWGGYEILKKYIWNGSVQYINLASESAFKATEDAREFEGKIGDLVLLHGNHTSTSKIGYNFVGFIKRIKGNMVRISNKTSNDQTAGVIRKILKKSLAKESILELDYRYWDKLEILKRKDKEKEENFPTRLKDIYGVDLLDHHYNPIKLGEYYRESGYPYTDTSFTRLRHTYFTFHGKEEVMVKYIGVERIYESPLRTTKIKDEDITKCVPVDCKTLILIKPEELQSEIQSTCDEIQSTYDALQKLALRAKEFLELKTLSHSK